MTPQRIEQLAWTAINIRGEDGRPLPVDLNADELEALLERFPEGRAALDRARRRWHKEGARR